MAAFRQGHTSITSLSLSLRSEAERVLDATVTAKVSGLGLSGPKRTLEPASIADTITYGGFFSLPGRDLYTIELAIRRSSTQQPVVVALKYDHQVGEKAYRFSMRENGFVAKFCTERSGT
jgi:hypothetical protein